jgi:hypothetical protein
MQLKPEIPNPVGSTGSPCGFVVVKEEREKGK